jgi:hypothetical protein
VSVESDLDRAVFLSDWGVDGILKRGSRPRKTIKGVFDNGYTEVDVGGTVGFATVSPRFLCRTIDLDGAADADSVTIDCVKYVIRVMEPDGTGITEIMLEKQ